MTTPVAAYSKTETAVKDYVIDWSARLSEYGTHLVSASWSSVPSGLIAGGAYAPTLSGNQAKVWLTGGTPGQTYTINCHGVDSNTPPREDDLSFQITIEGTPDPTDPEKTFDIRNYGAIEGGLAVFDCYAAIQAACDAAHAAGPGCVVYVPPGRWGVDIAFGHPLHVKEVTLTGPRDRGARNGFAVFPNVYTVGATLEFRNTTAVGEYGIFMDEEATVCNLEFWYPEQAGAGINPDSATPIDYDWLFYVQGQGCSLYNVSLGNTYRGVFWNANGGTMYNVRGAPVYWGVRFGRCADPPISFNVEFNPSVNGLLEGPLMKTFRWKNGVFTSIDGVEQFYFFGYFCFGYSIACLIQDLDSDGVKSSGTFVGFGCESLHCVRLIDGLGLAPISFANAMFTPRGSTNVFPDGSAGIAGDVIKFDDTGPTVGANRPIMQFTNVSVFNADFHGRSVWMRPNSYGICMINGGSFTGLPTAEYARNESPNALIQMNMVGMRTGVTRTQNPGGGVAPNGIVDVNPWII